MREPPQQPYTPYAASAPKRRPRALWFALGAVTMLLGLVRPTAGRLRLLGHDVPAALPDVIGRVGAIVESPALFQVGMSNCRPP